MNQAQQSRIRIEVFRTMILRHKGEDERSQFKVTPYKVLQYGVVPPEYQSEYEQITKAIIDSKKVIDDSPITLQEQLSYSTFFAENVNKVCGNVVISTSGSFAIKVKGNRQNVENTIGQTLKSKVAMSNEIVEATLKIREDKQAVLIWFKEKDNGNLIFKGLINIVFNGTNILISSDGYPQWRKVSYNTKDANSYIEITDKERIKRYFDTPIIKEILKPFYPKTENSQDRSRRLRLLKLQTNTFAFSQTK